MGFGNFFWEKVDTGADTDLPGSRWIWHPAMKEMRANHTGV
jgi:hypothetical protein